MIADFPFTLMRSIQFHFMYTHFVRSTPICRDKLDSNLNGKTINVLWAPNNSFFVELKLCFEYFEQCGSSTAITHYFLAQNYSDVILNASRLKWACWEPGILPNTSVFTRNSLYSLLFYSLKTIYDTNLMRTFLTTVLPILIHCFEVRANCLKWYFCIFSLM